MFMPRQISHSVERIAKQAIGKDWGLYAAMLDHWQEIVGKEFARDTAPSKITFPHQPNEARRRNGTLTVRLPKGLAMEFTFKVDQIKQRINSYFGYDAIGKIAFEPVYGVRPKAKTMKEPDPATIERLKSEVNVIENNELKDVLQAFGESLHRSNSE